MIEFIRKGVYLKFFNDDEFIKWLYDCVKYKSIKKSEAIILYVLGGRETGGRRFGEIQRFLVEMNGRDYDQFDCNTYETDKGYTVYDVGYIKVINNFVFKFRSLSDVENLGKIKKRIKGKRLERGYGTVWFLGGCDKVGLINNCCYKINKRYFVKQSCVEAICVYREKIIWNPKKYIVRNNTFIDNPNGRFL